MVSKNGMTVQKARFIFDFTAEAPLDLVVLEVKFKNLIWAYSFPRLKYVLEAIDAVSVGGEKGVVSEDNLFETCQLIADLYQQAFDTLVISIGETSQWALSKKARPNRRAVKGKQS